MFALSQILALRWFLLQFVARKSQESYLAKALPNWPIKTHGFDESAAR
jgi:hypothetical protein